MKDIRPLIIKGADWNNAKVSIEFFLVSFGLISFDFDVSFPSKQKFNRFKI